MVNGWHDGEQGRVDPRSQISTTDSHKLLSGETNIRYKSFIGHKNS